MALFVKLEGRRGHWGAVSNPSSYGDVMNQYNVLAYPRCHGRFRMVVQFKPDCFGGIVHWKVN